MDPTTETLPPSHAHLARSAFVALVAVLPLVAMAPLAKATTPTAAGWSETAGVPAGAAEGTGEAGETSETWVLPETHELRALRELMEEEGIRPGEAVGGTALLGVRLAGPMHRVPEDAPERVRVTKQEWDGFGAFVADVVPGSPADFAGLQPGDVVVQYGGIWVDRWDLLIRLASRSRVEREQEVWLLRDGVVVKAWIVPIDRATFEAEPPARPSQTGVGR